jgi:hypothetical protein
MRSNKKDPKLSERLTRVSRSSRASKAGDQDGAHLDKMQRSLGNQEMASRLQGAGGQRDQLLAFICARLKKIDGIQRKELAEMGDVREWYKQVAKGTPGYHLPDPTRWHDAARLYQRAGRHLCNGNLGEGARCIERAMEAEAGAMKSLPKQVTENLEAHEQVETEQPDELARIGTGSGAPRCAIPQELQLAERILSVVAKMTDAPPAPVRKRTANWWDEDEEEEEEDEAEG